MIQFHPHRVDFSQDIGFKGIFAAKTQISKALVSDLIEVITGIKVDRICSMG